MKNLVVLIIVALMLYCPLAKADTDYVETKRGVLHIRIAHGIVPTVGEMIHMSARVWHAHKEPQWTQGTVFFYVKDMPLNGMPYAAADFDNNILAAFLLYEAQLKLHEFLKSKGDTTKE